MPEKIAVIGAGVIGISTAWSLSQEGAEVTVIEIDSIACGATSGNGGVVTPGDSVVWAGPQAIKPMFKALLGRDESISVEKSALFQIIPYGIKFLKNCTKRKYKENVAAAYLLSDFSLKKTNDLISNLKLEVNKVSKGSTLIYETMTSLEAGINERSINAELGNVYEVFSEVDLLEYEPKLRKSNRKFAGALHSLKCMSGDSAEYTAQLADKCKINGVEIFENSKILKVNKMRDGFELKLSVHGHKKTSKFDQVVICAGSKSQLVSKKFGLKVLIQPVRGFAVTVPIRNAAATTFGAGVDEARHVAFSQMGSKMRFSCGAIYLNKKSQKGASASELAKRLAYVKSTAESLFGPDVFDFKQASIVARERPITPKGTPYISKTKHKGLWINAGHGPLGWTQAAGSAELIKDLIFGLTPQIDPKPYQLIQKSIKNQGEK